MPIELSESIAMVPQLDPQHHIDHGRLRVGTAPVNWNNNDLPNWRPQVLFPKILDEMQTAGYHETEWDESFGTDVDVLNHERAYRGMTFTGAYRWFDFVDDEAFARDLESIRPFLETLRGIGAGHLIVADSLRRHRVAVAGSVPADGSASLDESAYGRLAHNLDRLDVFAAGFNLAVHYHNHVGTYIETPHETETLLAQITGSRVDLCFDTGHYAFGGGDAREFLTTHHADIGYLHLKDVDPQVLHETRKHGWNFLDALRQCIFCPIGTGSARIAGIIELLGSVEFPGYVIVEQDTCRDDATLNARENLRMVRTFEAESRTQGRTLP